MTNTTQRPPAKGTSDNMWNTQFNSNSPAKSGMGYGDTKSNWNVRFDKGAGGRTRAANGGWEVPGLVGMNKNK